MTYLYTPPNNGSISEMHPDSLPISQRFPTFETRNATLLATKQNPAVDKEGLVYALMQC